MLNNRKLQICSAGSRKATHWPKNSILWSEFVEKLKTPVRGMETYEQYLAMSKAQQAELKDVGGYVGGTFTQDRRKAGCVEGRDLFTLDLDNIPAGQTEDILRRVDGLGCAAVVYSTRKHSSYTPRLRVVIPGDRTATADEYEPAARKIASLIGMEFCDPTTFENTRLMYWASCSANAEFVYQVFDKPFCSVDGILGMYGDWTDVSCWPQVPGSEAIARRRLAKQEDPTTKKGVIGAFCRVYSITQAMDAFIPGMYEETAVPGRFTYTGGSTVGGAVIYDNDLFLYSHHATDPCSGQLVNAFDLIRLHKFGDLDNESKEGTPVNKLPSFVAMSRLAVGDGQVSDLITRERMNQAKQAFSAAGQPAAEQSGEYDMSWLARLTKDGNGNLEKTINNVVLVLENDPLLKGKIVTDEFASCGMVIGKVPWSREDGRRRWKDSDDAGFYRYMETFYRITGREKLDNALLIVSSENRINDVRDYLQGLKWDGIRRIEGLLSEYLGAEDNAYTRAVMRKSLCAAVARAITGGVKFDYMPIFVGPQGIGKSTFLRILGKSWFSDSLTTFEGKEAAELIQGTWLNEVGELTAFTKQETQVIKQFLSKTDDIYRAAYGRRTDKYPRRCVFFGTSNDAEFLKDSTGNRRFWPVDVGIYEAKKSVWEQLPQEVDQIWAEAYTYWQMGEGLYLPKEIEQMAEAAQEEHRESSGKEGIIQIFLEREIPENWETMDLMQRRMFLQGNAKQGDGVALTQRTTVCAAEIWAECFGSDPKYLGRRESMEINAVLSGMQGWQKMRTPRKFGVFGSQRGFERVKPKPTKFR